MSRGQLRILECEKRRRVYISDGLLHIVVDFSLLVNFSLSVVGGRRNVP